jgi:hypothetical protein
MTKIVNRVRPLHAARSGQLPGQDHGLGNIMTPAGGFW